MCGFAELLEFIETVEPAALEPFGGKADIVAMMDKAAAATCDFYISHTATDGIPYWDTGAPGIARYRRSLHSPIRSGQRHEPVDSSAAAIAAQGLLRYGAWRRASGADGAALCQAGLTVLRDLARRTPTSASIPLIRG